MINTAVPVKQGTKIVFSKTYYASSGTHPFDAISWVTRDAVIRDAAGDVKFQQKNVEVPAFWSERATNIVAEKYFRVVNGVRESSAKQMIQRVASTIACAGLEQGIFADDAGAKTFEIELCGILVNQLFAFNSPVWFNIGVPGVKQQASACFIQSVKDTMDDITALITREMMLFKGGSGTGSNLSSLRSSYETLSGGGLASGPVSFMEVLDAGAGVTKSGGTTRRAAKMVVMNADHPDILVQQNGRPGFISCKSSAEQMAHDLIDSGKYSGEFNVPGNAYEKVGFQNANNSVRVTDDFMNAVISGAVWRTKKVTTGEVVHSYDARSLWKEIAKAAWFCGDPGIQFDTTTNQWHTCKTTGRINASNPCSEYLFLDDTACNLGSFNLLKFYDRDTESFDYEKFEHAVRVCITAMEILVGYSHYPSEAITKNSHDFRPLGIGYANLGALLMSMGLAYDSDEGRGVAAALTAIMSGVGYDQSAQLARAVGPFPKYRDNITSFREVMLMHSKAAAALPDSDAVYPLVRRAKKAWDDALLSGSYHGYRNAQISVIAPTGTISFLMDCDTTGIEPMLALVVYKKLVGGGMLTMPNEAVVPALKHLGYTLEDISDTLRGIQETGELPATVQKAAHRKVFQTAIGNDAVSVDGHLKMMAAVQPFLSGGISKTVNMPSTVTVDEVADTYMKAWELGLKCVAVYRDGCKRSQPAASKLSTEATSAEPAGLRWGERKRLGDERVSLTHKFNIGGQEGYLHIGLYEDGKPGELFVNIAKAGSTLHGIMDMMATAVSVGLQHGVPVETFVDKFAGTKFEPAGFTKNDNIRSVASIGDYLARYLSQRFLETDSPSAETPAEKPALTPARSLHGDPCRSCGNMTVRAGSCWVCVACGTTTGCG